ncbi:cyclase family protein [Bryobacter aggregatus]|uniref:cyclase family protein n=1 Tax=Bryobacter aggregatus TaxID=360054 RepID=UPI0004E0BF70|nr:cyclase family protein [Bryobacter aggregatus]
MAWRYWDISVALRDGMVCWPGDPLPRIEQVAAIDQGDVCNLTRLDMSAHTGTHMDAPRHFVPAGSAIDQQDLDALIGPARVVEIHHPNAIGRDELRQLHPQPGERLLFKTRNANTDWNSAVFNKDFIYLSDEGAQYLVACGVRTIGVDYLSIGGFHHDTVETHVTILSAGISVIEGLDLSAVEPGDYELICLPLKIAGADGAPARALLRRPA